MSKKSYTEMVKSLNHLPLVLILGTLTGLGAHSTLIGVFIVSFIFLVFNLKKTIPYPQSVTYIFCALGFNLFLTQKHESFLALIFLSGFFVIIFNLFKKIIFIPAKSIINGFYTGILAALLISCLPIAFGNVPIFDTTPIQYQFGIFNNIDTFSIIIFFIVLTLDYYLSRVKYISTLSPFLSVILASVIAYIYKFDVISLGFYFKNYSFVPTADFGSPFLLILFSALLGFILFLQTNIISNYSKETKNNKNKIIIATAISTLFSPFLDGVGGGVECLKKNGTIFSSIFLLVFYLIFLIFFKQISNFIPLAAVGSIVVIQIFETLKTNFKNTGCKNLKSKINFIIIFLTSFYNILLGVFISGILSLFSRKKNG